MSRILDFYRFIQACSIEYHWVDNPETNERDVVFFVLFNDILEMYAAMAPYDFIDDRIRRHMKDGYFTFWGSSICDKLDVELTEMFGQDGF